MRRIWMMVVAVMAVAIVPAATSWAAAPTPSFGQITATLTDGPLPEGGKTWCVYSADVTITFKGKYELQVRSPSGAPGEVVVTGSGTRTVTAPNLWVEAGTSGSFTATAVKQHQGIVATGQSDPVAVPPDCTSS